MAHSPNFTSHYPSSSSSSSSSSLFLLANAEKTFDGDWHHIFEHSVQEDDPLWKAYIKEAALFDNRMIDEWNKIIDTVLVYVALFTTVLTAFVIETARQFKPDPADISNQVLVAIYQNQLANLQNSSAYIIDTAALFKPDPTIYHNAIFSNLILFADLALAVIVSVVALFAKLWLIYYSAQVNSAGSPYERAMRRQEAYTGAVAWRLGTVIKALPFLLLLPVFTFGFFIFRATAEYQRFIGYTVGGLFAAGLVFIFLLTTAAAFIPGCPFHTSASTWMRFLFKLILRHSLPKWIVGAKTSKRTRGLRIISVIIFSLLTLIATAFLVLQYSYVFFALIWFPTAAVFWLAGDPPKSDGKPSKYGIHHLLLFGGVVITPLIAFAGSFIDRPPVFIALFSTASIIFAVIATYAIRTYKCIPNTEEAEAVAWLLKSTSSQDPAYFRNAGQIAAGSEHRKALLLSSLLPLLLPLITSRNSHHKEHDLETYVACLAQLSAFTDAEGSFWKNEGAVVHPSLPDTSLLTMLKKLELESPQNSRLRIAARDALRYYGNNAAPVQQEYA